MSDTPFYKLPLVPKYHTGGTVTGRFPRKPEGIPFLASPGTEHRGLEGVGRREGMTYVKMDSKTVLAHVDYSQIEARIMAQLALSTRMKRVGPDEFEVFGTSLEEVAQKWMELVLNEVVDKLLRDFQTQIDEEGCGATFAALKTWGNT